MLETPEGVIDQMTAAVAVLVIADGAFAVASAGDDGDGSLYVLDRPVHLYTLAGAPLPTRWIFPEHLSTAEECEGTGADASVELARFYRLTRP